MTVTVWELTTGGAVGVRVHLVCVYNCRGGVAVGLTSSIESPYKKGSLDRCAATVKHGEAVFTYGSPRSSAPGSDCDGAAINE